MEGVATPEENLLHTIDYTYHAYYSRHLVLLVETSYRAKQFGRRVDNCRHYQKSVIEAYE
jgi:hypothetical protein